MTCYCGHEYEDSDACPICHTHRAVAWVERSVQVCFFLLVVVFFLLDFYFQVDYLPYLESAWAQFLELVEAAYRTLYFSIL